MRTVRRGVVVLISVLCLWLVRFGPSAVMGQTAPAIPGSRGFYSIAGGKYLKLPECGGDECGAKCVTSAWVEAVKATPVTRNTPAFLLRSLVVPATAKGQVSSSAASPGLAAVQAIVTLRVDSEKPVVIESSLKVAESTEGALLLSFKKELEPGTYAVLQSSPAAAHYARVESATGSLCFLVLDDESNIIGPATPLGVFVVR
jgi:hypothetical protein